MPGHLEENRFLTIKTEALNGIKIMIPSRLNADFLCAHARICCSVQRGHGTADVRSHLHPQKLHKSQGLQTRNDKMVTKQ